MSFTIEARENVGVGQIESQLVTLVRRQVLGDSF